MAWIGANLKYKRKRATVDQKALKRVLTEVAKATLKEIKADVMTFRDTGALGYSLGMKVVDPKKDYRYVAIVGVKGSRYSKQTSKGLKIPNKYARRVNLRRHFIQRGVLGKDTVVRNLLIQAKKELIQTR